MSRGQLILSLCKNVSPKNTGEMDDILQLNQFENDSTKNLVKPRHLSQMTEINYVDDLLDAPGTSTNNSVTLTNPVDELNNFNGHFYSSINLQSSVSTRPVITSFDSLTDITTGKED